MKALDLIDKKFDPKKLKGQIKWNEMDEEALKPQSKEEFLKKLPKQIIRDGKIISVRDEIS